MDTVVTLTQVDKNGNPIIREIGGIDQYIFKTIKDALFHLCYADDIIMTMKKSSNSAHITIEYFDKTIKYYTMYIEKPISYE